MDAKENIVISKKTYENIEEKIIDFYNVERTAREIPDKLTSKKQKYISSKQ